MSIVNAKTAPHYSWGAACDGWRLCDGADLRVIEEEMPPGAAEVRHRHNTARQVFYVLEGQLTLEVDGQHHTLSPRDALTVPPVVPHQAKNASAEPVRFLVISAPTTDGDRVETP